jgi:hypothetical protein
MSELPFKEPTMPDDIGNLRREIKRLKTILNKVQKENNELHRLVDHYRNKYATHEGH